MKDNLIVNGWHRDCVTIPSPHFNQRPADSKIRLLVVHNISLPPGHFGSNHVTDLFLGKLNPDEDPFFKEIYQLEVSAHCFIRRTGEVIQYVSFDDRAWHAGVSNYLGESNCNDFSIGIELEGTDDSAYTNVQYEQLVSLVRSIISAYPSITTKDIVGHCDIAPNRKTDPGPSFDWAKFRLMLEE